MNPIIYLDGFQEDKTSNRSPWKQLVEHFWEDAVESVDIPWDINNPESKESGFSMDAVKNAVQKKVIQILDSQQGELKVIAYSLSAQPTLDAITELSEKYKSRIKVFLIHPAYNPLHAVKVMDWIRSEQFPQLQDDEYYLHGDVTKVFNTLIADWKWNGIQFQEDLSKYHDISFKDLEAFQIYCKTLWFPVEIIWDKIWKDKVINDKDWDENKINYSSSNRLKIQISHWVKLSQNDLLQIVN